MFCLFENLGTDIPSPEMAEIRLDQRQQLLNGICFFEKIFAHLALRSDLVQRGLQPLGGETVAVLCAKNAMAGGVGVDDELRLAGGRPIPGDLTDV